MGGNNNYVRGNVASFRQTFFQKLPQNTFPKTLWNETKNLPIGVGVIEHLLTVTDTKDFQNVLVSAQVKTNTFGSALFIGGPKTCEFAVVRLARLIHFTDR